ncbi:hypothetical protein RDI58_022055 [Solanum bulbocastanum]|uniref:Uncharacterized protein n=1 Tax=Solanum bulbocastanum TaxID=147425 RepID=A0AAN8T9V8_SOLBU
MRIGDSSSEQSDVMASMPSLTRFVHPGVSLSSTTALIATQHDEMPPVAPGQKDRLGRLFLNSIWIFSSAYMALCSSLMRVVTTIIDQQVGIFDAKSFACTNRLSFPQVCE